MLERLQKIISRAGIASRRHAEQLILSGAVTVNGRVITELGTKADPERDHITVGPRVVRIEPRARESYFAFHKPPQVVSTLSDPEGRPCLGPHLRGFKGRLFPVGRLEFDAAGLLVLTSDGELTSDLMRAAAAIPQTWRFKVKGRISDEARQAIERDAQARVRVYREAANAWYEAEVRNAPRDLLRQSLVRQGILVEKMVRTGFGGVELGALPAGEMRELAPEEINRLRRVTQGRAGPSEKRREERRRPVPRRPADSREGLAAAVAGWRRARGHGGARPGRGKSRGRHGPTSRFAGTKRKDHRGRMPAGLRHGREGQGVE
jgi:23S rRNA pseudouridine2605 synthase